MKSMGFFSKRANLLINDSSYCSKRNGEREETIYRDSIKNQYCEKNDVNLLRIKFSEFEKNLKREVI